MNIFGSLCILNECAVFFCIRCLNISALQSCLSKITLIREKDLDRARRYFEMLYLGFMVCATIVAIKYVVCVDICFGGQLLFSCGILHPCWLSLVDCTLHCVVVTSSTGLAT